ncbi:MAG: transcription antitermination factor NusB [Acidimicrobiia bacterium]|nr:transcription antitermination factor NusB [Acidimicrobiia bacterium]MDH3469775.1 transcription antitermination factor NusB [Acidimicrobiia bacterium]
MSDGDARERALRALYATDQGEGGSESGENLTGRAKRLYEGVVSEMDSLDAALEAVSDKWRVDRMPAVDRNILRLALYELRNEINTPHAVIISEAVKHAKTYSTERSGGFINGVLGRLASEERSANGA